MGVIIVVAGAISIGAIIIGLRVSSGRAKMVVTTGRCSLDRF